MLAVSIVSLTVREQLDRHILNELADMETEVIQDYEELYFPGGTRSRPSAPKGFC